MRSEPLLHQHLPTPPMHSTECPSELSPIAHYNADGSHAFGEGSHGSPGPVMHHRHPSRADSHSGSALGLGIHYDSYGPAAKYFHDGPLHGMPNNQGPFSPPTPHSTTEEDPVRMMNLHGTNFPPATPPLGNEQGPAPKARSRILKTPRGKKSKGVKAEQQITRKLPSPLSNPPEELAHIPVKNMEVWANRNAETRRKEAEERKGYIPRPMNSFMLYRSAYAERAKAWCLKNNHQVVSTVAGQSWPLEPMEIRELYNEYAKIERINHQNAHPTYKFSPSKTVAPARKRKSEWSDEEPSDLDDFEWAPGSGRSRSRKTRQLERSLSYPDNGFMANPDPRYEPNRPGMNPALWDMPNGARHVPMTMAMAHNDLYDHYFPSSAYPAMHMNSNYTMDNARTRSISASFSSENGLLGLPGTVAGELMQPYPSHGNTTLTDGQLDPMLLPYAGGHAETNPLALQHAYPSAPPGSDSDKLPSNDFDNLLGSWQSDPTLGTLEPESEFEQWLGVDS